MTAGGWTTQIIDAGAFGTNVARIDLTYHPDTNSTTLDTSASPAMTDAGLFLTHAGLVADPAIAALVHTVDQQLNTSLGAFFKQTFPDYDPTSLAKGIYHPVGTANLQGFDFIPFQASLVATGVLRGKLLTGVPLSFADVYNVLPLGITPDSSQALPVGYPLVSAYLDLADVKSLCALQLLAQSNLAPADYYLNFSGLKYGLKSTEAYLYFKYATAAGVLQLVAQKAAAGSIPATQALFALLTLSRDSGAALLAAYGNDNPYAGALVTLNDANPTLPQIAANLGVVGQVAVAAAADAASGTNTVTTLVVSKAVAAIDTVSAFGVTDAANTGSTTDLSSTSRVRVATDLFAVLALGAVQTQFGVTITPYKAATGSATISAADLPGVLANRINATPAGTGVQELKAWMALLSYLTGGLKGNIPTAYASTGNFTQFGSAGAAVQTRNASYPLASIGQLSVTLSTLLGAPPCTLIGTPTVTSVTTAGYSTSLSASGTIIVWGTGFIAGGGNSIHLTRASATDSVMLADGTSTYFWNLSANQINSTLPNGTAPGQWLLS